MEDFDIKDFGELLKIGISVSIPKETPETAEAKHGKLKEKPRNPLQLYQQVQNEFDMPIKQINKDTYYFDLGSERLEAIYPYYHILEDAEVIHRRYKGTKRSKGSQDKIQDVGKRDYGRVIIKKNKTGKTTYYQEYRKNVRGKRSQLKTETYRIVKDNGEVEYMKKVVGTKTSTTYVNTNYHYIEKNLEQWLIPSLMAAYDLKRLRNGASDLMDGQFDLLTNQFNI